MKIRKLSVMIHLRTKSNFESYLNVNNYYAQSTNRASLLYRAKCFSYSFHHFIKSCILNRRSFYVKNQARSCALNYCQNLIFFIESIQLNDTQDKYIDDCTDSKNLQKLRNFQEIIEKLSTLLTCKLYRIILFMYRA